MPVRVPKGHGLHPRKAQGLIPAVGLTVTPPGAPVSPGVRWGRRAPLEGVGCEVSADKQTA